LHAWTGFQRWQDDIVFLKNGKCWHWINFFTFCSFLLSFSYSIFDLTSLWPRFHLFYLLLGEYLW
jgi:hypothetical protein